jgi:hypothetical protein
MTEIQIVALIAGIIILGFLGAIAWIYIRSWWGYPELERAIAEQYIQELILTKGIPETKTIITRSLTTKIGRGGKAACIEFLVRHS